MRVARGVAEPQAAHIFDLMEKFAGYGFNKSHSAAYALLSYQTAWLKAHYPAAFMAAVLSSDMDKTDKVVTLIDECADMGLNVLPPDVNESVFAFAVDGEREHPLWHGRHQGRRARARSRRIIRGARSATARSEPARGPVPAHRPCHGSTAACSRR